MSEPDDKPDSAAGTATKPKSLFDADWGGLLGDSNSSSGSRPIFAPPSSGAVKVPTIDAPKTDAPKVEVPKVEAPKVEPPKVEPEADAPQANAAITTTPEDAAPDEEAASSRPLPAATSAPRTSESPGTVSGEYVAPEPRPEPATPPRYEPPEGVSPEYDNSDEDTEDRLPILPPIDFVPTLVTQDDETQVDDDPRDEEPDAKPEASEPASEPSPADSGGGDSPTVAAIPSSDGGGGARNFLILVAAVAAVAVIAVFIKNARDEGPRDSTVATPDPSSTKKPGNKPGKPELGPELGKPEVDTGDDGPAGETGASETGEAETGGPEPVEPARPGTPKSGPIDPRDPSLIPPGTPEENAKAFIKLPVSIHDGPPIGGIGRTGIHIDAISTSRGRDNTDCDQPTEVFSIAVAKYVNVCFRVVHPREQESLRVIWERDGKVTRRGRVRIPELHAYTTRAYLLLRPEYVGSWRVRIVPEGEEELDLAVAEFVITE